MTKIIFLLPLFLSSCAHRYAPRSEADSNYAHVEKESSRYSAERVDHASRAAAMALKIRALDSQIANQRVVIERWEANSEVPSAPAMIRNARARIDGLNSEKTALLEGQRAELEAIDRLDKNAR